MLEPLNIDQRPPLVIIGGGGHAKALLAVLLDASWDIVGILENGDRQTSLLGVPVVGDDRCLATLRSRGVWHAAIGVGTARDNAIRTRIWNWLRSEKMTIVSAIDRTAIVSRHAWLGEGVTVMPGAVVQAAANIGDNVLINTGAIVEHDCRLEDHVHVASGTVLCGNVWVETGAFIGAGVSIQPGVRVGKNATIGTGAVVVKDVPADTTVVGNPAKPLNRESRSWTISRAS